MRTKPIYHVALALVLLIAIVTSASCANQGTSSPAPTASKGVGTGSADAGAKASAPAPAAVEKTTTQEPYTINFIATLTGQLATAGQKQKLGAEAFQKYINARGGINGRPINIQVLDDQSDAKVTVQLATDLIAKKVPVFMGPGMTGPTLAVAPLIASNGPVVYCTTPGVYPDPGSYLFAAMPSNMAAYTGMVNYLRNKGWTRIALLSTTDASGADIADSVTKLLKQPENSSIKIVADEKAEPTATSMAAQAAKIKASNAQAVILGMIGAPFSTAVKGLMQAGLDLPVATSVGNQNYALMEGNKDVLPKDLYFAGVASDAFDVLPAGQTKDAITEWRKLLADSGSKPEVPITSSWEAAAIIVEALKKTGTDTTPAKLRDAIESIKAFNGLYGTYNFSRDDHRGVGVDGVYISRWDVGKGTWLAASGQGGTLPKN